MINHRRRRMQTQRRIKRIVIAVLSILLCVALYFGGKFLIAYINERDSGGKQDDLIEVQGNPDETTAPEIEEQPTPAPTVVPVPEEETEVIPPNPAALMPGGSGGGSDETKAAPEGEDVEKTESEITEAPTEALRFTGVKIGIDPGHQAKGNNEKEPIAPGSSEKKAKVSSGTSGVSTKTAEHVRDLEISLKLRDALVSLGAEVYMTRETADVNISNVERAMMMNELEVDLVLRLHCNGSTNQKKSGMGLYVKKTGEGAEESLKAAEALLPEMVAATGANEDGIFRNDTYTGLNWSSVPCILVEMGYMTNPEEDKNLASPDYQDKLVAGMIEGIGKYVERHQTEQE